ncbi:FKBP-type peptidyl-prolyl cis-trans isomerase [Gordonia sp. DT30]|uniref:FKBP-type peptidyl-prolyl cis-trans isomerase n=1 Tax=unclassified Gordonia (in: high G+C Gram-positive bacteria) TaxID=2657482 RepID=UPI003CF21F44
MRILRGVLAVLALVAALVLSACGSSDKPAAPVNWTQQGTTGSVTVTSPGDPATAPTVHVTTPFGVDQTLVHVLRTGTGATVAPGANVSVSYVGVNGRTGDRFDSSYTRGAPADFSLAQVIPGFSKAIVGQHVGSTVAAAIAPADGYTSGMPAAGIEAGDTLVFALTIVSAGG